MVIVSYSELEICKFTAFKKKNYKLLITALFDIRHRVSELQTISPSYSMNLAELLAWEMNENYSKFFLK